MRLMWLLWDLNYQQTDSNWKSFEPIIRTMILSNVLQTRNLSLLVIGWKNTPYMKFDVFKWIPFVDHWEKPGIFWTVLRLFDFVKDLVATKWSGNTEASELSPKLQKRSTNAVKIIRKLGLNDIDRLSLFWFWNK